MADLRNLSYLVLGVSDIDAWKAYAETAGMHIGYLADSRVGLRLDDRVHRFILEQSETDDILAVGWEVATDREFEAFAVHLEACGVAFQLGSGELARRRNVERVLVMDDPNGVVHEISYGMGLAEEPFRSPTLGGGGFVTDPFGAGHVVIMAKDYAETVAFYKSALNLRVSDYIRETLADGSVADITFFHTLTGRHHSIATVERPSRTRINHFMVQVQAFEDVGLALDRFKRNGYHVAMSLGQHPNDRMFSFYVVTPSGFSMEFGHGGVVIDDANWEVVTYPRRSLWGHERSGAGGLLPTGKAE